MPPADWPEDARTRVAELERLAAQLEGALTASIRSAVRNEVRAHRLLLRVATVLAGRCDCESYTDGRDCVPCAVQYEVGAMRPDKAAEEYR